MEIVLIIGLCFLGHLFATSVLVVHLVNNSVYTSISRLNTHVLSMFVVVLFTWFFAPEFVFNNLLVFMNSVLITWLLVDYNGLFELEDSRK